MSELEKLLEWRGPEKRINYSLDNIKSALKFIGNPERNVYPLVIGGTNGKGSTALYIASAMKAAHLRCATFLSPHLQHPKERMLIDLTPIEEGALLDLAVSLHPVREKFSLSYFEFLTLIFFQWCRTLEVPFVVLEVGLGGRLDSTNVVDAIAAAITNISLDHQEFLGDTQEKILAEKLGIVKEETLLFTGVREPHLIDQIEKYCMERDAIYYFSKELSIQSQGMDWSGQRITVNGHPFFLPSPTQSAKSNAALAFLFLRIVFPRLDYSLFQSAFESVRNPGRFETVQEDPRVILSGDHNLAGVLSLKETLHQLKGAANIKIVCGFSPDKQCQLMYDELKALDPSLLLTAIPRYKESMPPAYWQMGSFEPDCFRALEKKIKEVEKDEVLVVTGSLYLVGALRRLWKPEVQFWESPSAELQPTYQTLGVSNRPTPRTAESKQNLVGVAEHAAH